MVAQETNYQNFHYLKMIEIGQEYFNYVSRDEANLLSQIKNSIKFYSFRITGKHEENFIRINAAPVVWINESKFIKDLELYLNKNPKSNIDHFVLVKEYYTKWVINKDKDEKKQIASATARLIEKNPKDQNILLKLYLVSLFTFEESLFDRDKAITLFDEIIDYIGIEFGKASIFKHLLYFVNIIYSFLYMKTGEYVEAKGKLLDATSEEQEGLNSKIYLMIIEMILGNTTSVRGTLNDILDYDMGRIKIALDNNNFNMFEFFLRNNIISIIFNFPSISAIYDDFDPFFEECISSNSNLLSEINDNIKLFKTYPDSNYVTKGNLENIHFLERVIDKYITSNNFVLLSAAVKLKVKYFDTIEAVKDNIRKSFNDVVNNKIRSYKIGISEQQQVLDNIHKERERLLETLKREEEIAITKFEERVEEEVQKFEGKIDNLTKSDELNPKLSFQNTLVYGVIIALLVSILGGFAGYSNSFSANTNDFNHILSNVFLKGLQWGLITIIIAFIVAILASGAVLLEKSNQKMKFVKKISDIKRYKEKEIQKIQKTASSKEENILKAFIERVQEQEEIISKNKKEKEEKERKLKEDAAENISMEIERFQKYLIKEQKG